MMLQGQEHNDSELIASATTAESQDSSAAHRPAFHRIRRTSSDDGLDSLLRAAGAVEVDDLDSIAERLGKDPNFEAVIVFPNPVLELGDSFNDGMTFEQGVAAWRETMERVLAVFRRDRRRITLVDGDSARRAPDRFLRLLTERNAALQGQLPGAVQALSRAAELKHVIAAQALKLDEPAAALLSELEASALPLGSAFHVDFDALFDEESAGANNTELDDLMAENQQLMNQLSRAREELEIHIVEKRKLEKIRLAKNSLQEELEASREEWAEERKALADKLGWAADDLAAMRQSLSWRLTSPLRRVLGLFVGGTKL